MKFLKRFLDRWRKIYSKTPVPAELKSIYAKITAPHYTADTTTHQMRADYAICHGLRNWVRANESEEAYLKYLRALDSFQSLIESREKLEQLYQNQHNAEARLDASYAAQRLVN